MKVLVTGGAGFIGSHIVDELVEHGHDVVSLDSLSSDAHGSTPVYLNPNAEQLTDDIRDPGAVSNAVEGVEVICHQAGRVGLGVDFSDVDQYVDHNVVGTALLLKTMFANGFDGRLVLASSMVVYGEGRYECPVDGLVSPGPRRVQDLDERRFEPPCPQCDSFLDWRPVPEDAALDPRNVYAATKVQQEQLAFAYSRETGVPVIALRYHNVYGPRMPRNTPYAGVASLFRSALEAGRAPSVFEDGGQMRDFVHVRDVASANILAMTGPRTDSRVFNIGSGEPQSILNMAEILAAESETMNGDARTGLQPLVTGEYRLGDVRHIVASSDRAQNELGYKASISFTEGMAEFASAPLRQALV